MWCKTLLEELGFKQQPITVYQDNISTIKFLQNPDNTNIQNATKHLRTKYSYLTENIQNNNIDVQYLQSDYMTADVLTKTLSKRKFQ